MRDFNISENCNGAVHYMMDDSSRLEGAELLTGKKRYMDYMRTVLSRRVYADAIVRYLPAMALRKFKQTEY